MSINVKLHGSRILVKPLEASNVSKGGIITAPVKKKLPNVGEITALSIDCDGFKVGDTVMFPTYAGTEIDLDEGTFKIVEAEDIWLTIPRK